MRIRVATVLCVRATNEEAFKEAGVALSGGSSPVWVTDERGNLILPADQVKARLSPSASAAQGFAL